MRAFLDMCVIVYCCFGTGHKLEKKAVSFVKNKGGNKFIICCYILNKNLPKWLERQEVLFKEIKRKIINSDYNLWGSEKSEILLKKDKIIGEKILKKYYISRSKEDFLKDITGLWRGLKMRIDIFMQKYIDERVIPVGEIDSELKSSLFTYLDGNMSDAMTLASGIQEHNKNEVILVTFDRTHWTKDNLDWAIPPSSDLEKKYPKLPEIKYL